MHWYTWGKAKPDKKTNLNQTPVKTNLTKKWIWINLYENLVVINLPNKSSLNKGWIKVELLLNEVLWNLPAKMM